VIVPVLAFRVRKLSIVLLAALCRVFSERRAGISTAAVGLIHSPDLAEHIVANQHADLVVLGRTLLAEPYWPLRAAKALRAEAHWPHQYERGNIF